MNVKDFFYKEEYDIPKDVKWTNLLDEMMQYTSPIKAKAALQFLIEDFMKHNPDVDLENATKNVKSKIGYWAGYFDDDVRLRVEELFDCEHPYFGKIKENGTVTAEEAYRKGYELAQALKMKKE